MTLTPAIKGQITRTLRAIKADISRKQVHAALGMDVRPGGTAEFKHISREDALILMQSCEREG